MPDDRHEAVTIRQSSAPPVVKVLYLGGLGRSGSTLVERLVGELPGVCALGEVVHLWERGLVKDEKCSCGQSFSTCPFWQQVGVIAYGGWDTVDSGNVLALKNRVDRNRYIPRLMMPKLRVAASRDLASYLRLYESLYAAALEVSGASALVDSSKHASLAFVLRRSTVVDLRVVQIVRDSAAVAYSWGKVVERPESRQVGATMPRYGPVKAALLWTAHNALFDVLKLTGTHVQLVRYEDFMAQPTTSLSELADQAGLALPRDALHFLSREAATLTECHTVAGNPMRFFTGSLPLTVDEAWRTQLSKRSGAIVRAMTTPMRWRLGYGSTGAEAASRSAGWRQQDTKRSVGGALSPPYPSVTVVVPTRDRPELLRLALQGIREQDYPGVIECLVVHDRSTPDSTLACADARRGVAVMPNTRRPGLAGARNTGIEAAKGDLVAFCDDDDVWHPTKLSGQVAALALAPGSVAATTGIRVLYGDHSVDRSLAAPFVTFPDLLRSRLAELHPSTFLLWRRALLDKIGLVSEDIPGGYGEDYEFLLRAARVAPILNVPGVHVDILWHEKSYFDSRWETVAAGLTWLLATYPEFDGEPRGKARITGQIAFAHAARGRPSAAVRWSLRTLRLRPSEPRALLALGVAAHAISASRVLRALHARGRGI